MPFAVSRKEKVLTLSQWDAGRYYAVTSTDRYGNESEAVQQEGAALSSETGTAGPVPVADKTFRLPDLHSQLDARFAVIETLQGKIVTTKPYSRERVISVADLPEGMYVLRSLNRKGVTHRLGFLKIER